MKVAKRTKTRSIIAIARSAKIIALCGIIILLFGTCSARNDGAGSDRTINIRFASSIPTAELSSLTSASSMAIGHFAKEIEKQSNGRITVTMFPDGQLASSTAEHVTGLLSGAFDMCNLNNGAWSDYTPAFAGLNIPYLYFDFETAWAVLDSEQLGQNWLKFAQEATNLIPLTYLDVGFRQLTNSIREVRTPEDLRGIKLRTMVDNLQMAAWNALGVAVTPVPYAELYTALQQRLVDGQENPVSNIVGARLFELQPYMTITNHNYTATIIAASPIIWKRLSQEDQVLVRSVWKEAQELSRQNIIRLAEEQMSIIKNYGVRIYYPSDDELRLFQNGVMQVWPEVEKEMGTREYNKLINFVNDFVSNR